jgi:hypothetical protein
VNLDRLERLEARIAETVAWWERPERLHPNPDPAVSARASELAALVAVARAAVTLLDALADVEDLTEAERQALAVIEEVVA